MLDVDSAYESATRVCEVEFTYNVDWLCNATVGRARSSARCDAVDMEIVSRRAQPFMRYCGDRRGRPRRSVARVRIKGAI